jgi:hypothetical protein
MSEQSAFKALKRFAQHLDAQLEDFAVSGFQ